MATNTITAVKAADKFDQIWSALPTADRYALMGHDRDELSPGEKSRLGSIIDQLARARRVESRIVNRARANHRSYERGRQRAS